MVVHDGQVAVEVPRAVNQYAGPAWPLLDPSLGDHPAVADQHQVGRPETVPDVGGQVGECGRVGGVAGLRLVSATRRTTVLQQRPGRLAAEPMTKRLIMVNEIGP